MAGVAPRRSLPVVGWTRRPAAFDDDAVLAAVYGAALAAAADEEAAIDIAVDVLVRARSAPIAPVVEAVRRAVLESPAPGFAPLTEDEREALALARLARLDVHEIAAATGASVAEVKARLNAGLRQLARSPQCA
jgi:DNA-directed RNA polymerase specialized sigma24 family protein